MQLNVIYEDKDIIVCFKPAGVATQTAKISSQDMVSMLKNYLAKQKGEKAPYVGIIHRLDQPVSGLLVFAKNQKAAALLSRQIQDGNANKDYIALCQGTLGEKKGTLVHYIAKDSVTKLAKVIDERAFADNEIKDNAMESEVISMAETQTREKDSKMLYKKAILSYEVETEFEDSSIIKVHLQTGRFHQIRGQFSFIGHALLGDAKYGSKESQELSRKKRIRNIALCANHLVLKHPTTGKEMEFVLEEKYLPEWYRK